MCACKRAADKGLVTGATPAPPCKTCSQQNIKNRTTQVHGTTINPAAFSLRLLGLLSPVSRRQSEPPASLSRDFFIFLFFCLITTITATPARIISVISLSLEEVERGNNRNDSLESAGQLCLAAHPQAPLLLVLQPNTQSRALWLPASPPGVTKNKNLRGEIARNKKAWRHLYVELSPVWHRRTMCLV